jgi:APA family basic amino acid/polyamine antiporter
VLACVYLMANLSIETWLRFLVWLALGLLFYGVYGYRHSRLRRTEQPDTARVQA